MEQQQFELQARKNSRARIHKIRSNLGSATRAHAQECTSSGTWLHAIRCRMFKSTFVGRITASQDMQHLNLRHPGISGCDVCLQGIHKGLHSSCTRLPYSICSSQNMSHKLPGPSILVPSNRMLCNLHERQIQWSVAILACQFSLVIYTLPLPVHAQLWVSGKQLAFLGLLTDVRLTPATRGGSRKQVHQLPVHHDSRSSIPTRPQCRPSTKSFLRLTAIPTRRGCQSAICCAAVCKLEWLG